MSDETELIDGQRNARKPRGGSGGAYREARDGRLTSIIAWVLGVLGSLSVLVLGSVGAWLTSSINRQTDSINDLNLTVAKVAVRMDAKDQRDDAQDMRASRTEEKVSAIDGRVYTLEGRNLRGGPEIRRGR